MSEKRCRLDCMVSWSVLTASLNDRSEQTTGWWFRFESILRSSATSIAGASRITSASSGMVTGRIYQHFATFASDRHRWFFAFPCFRLYIACVRTTGISGVSERILPLTNTGSEFVKIKRLAVFQCPLLFTKGSYS